MKMETPSVPPDLFPPIIDLETLGTTGMCRLWFARNHIDCYTILPPRSQCSSYDRVANAWRR